MKKLIIGLLFLLSCNVKKYKYTITIPWENSTFYYYTDFIAVDSVSKCITFIDDYYEDNREKHLPKSVCGTYQITQNY